MNGLGCVLLVALSVEIAPLERTFEAAPGLYCGSAPADAAGYAALAKFGVRTLVRVDGLPPDAEAARRAGLKVVHLPVRFEGLDADVAPILQALKQLPGPHYVGCLYGSPRAPAVAALAMRALDGRSLDEAKAFLQRAGVGESYGGVYASLAKFAPPTSIPPRPDSQPFPERADVTPLVAAMTELVVAWDPLRKWKAAELQLADAEQASALRKSAGQAAAALQTSAALPQSAEHGAEFVALLCEAKTAADALAAALAQPPPLDEARRTEILRQIDLVGGACSRCHRDYRN